jgi:hypothetical protein
MHFDEEVGERTQTGIVREKAVPALLDHGGEMKGIPIGRVSPTGRQRLAAFDSLLLLVYNGIKSSGENDPSFGVSSPRRGHPANYP